MSLEQSASPPAFRASQSTSRILTSPLSLYCILLAILLLFILLYPQTGDGDAIMHYLNAHDSLAQPAKLMGSWARWGSKIPLLIPAQFGLSAARCMSAFISIVCAWQTVRLAEDLKIPNAPLAAILLIFQPFVFSLAADTMTEMPFALGVVIALRLWIAGRITASCWVMGYLPTVRPEGFFLCTLWAVMILARRHATRRVNAAAKLGNVSILGWGTLLWFIGCWVLWRDPTYFFASGWAWPADSLRVYGHGSFFAYLNRWPIYCGPVLLILFLISTWKFTAARPTLQTLCISGILLLLLELTTPPWFREHILPWPNLALAAIFAWRTRAEKFAPAIFIFLLIFFLHSILWWRGWFASCGLMRILACAAPMTAIICLVGWNAISPRLPAFARATILCLIPLTAVIYYLIEPMHHRIFPLEKACAFVARHDLLRSSPMIIFGDPMAQAALNLPPNPPNLLHNDCNRATEMIHLLHAPLGSIGLWDNQHAQQWFGVSIADLPSLGYTTLYTTTSYSKFSIEWLEPAHSPSHQTYIVIRKDHPGSLPRN